MILTGNEKILIKNLEENDLECLRTIIQNPNVYRYEPSFLAERQGTPEEALRDLMSMDLQRDRQCIFGVFETAAPDVLAGLFELYDYKSSGKVISIGYRFAEEFWNRGLASQSVRDVVKYLRENTEVELVTAHVMPHNGASARVLTKNGFVYLLTKEEDWGFGRPVTADVYTLDLI